MVVDGKMLQIIIKLKHPLNLVVNHLNAADHPMIVKRSSNSLFCSITVDKLRISLRSSVARCIVALNLYR